MIMTKKQAGHAFEKLDVVVCFTWHNLPSVMFKFFPHDCITCSGVIDMRDGEREKMSPSQFAGCSSAKRAGIASALVTTHQPRKLKHEPSCRTIKSVEFNLNIALDSDAENQQRSTWFSVTNVC